MTTYCEEKVKCSLCAVESGQVRIGSTNAFGSSDLDMRPPEMQRSTMGYWVQRCPQCGYCASDISKSPPGASEAVASQAYKDQLKDAAYPWLANEFLCKAIVYSAAKYYPGVAWAFIHAAWACDDDTKHSEQAIACRRMAADAIVHSEAEGQVVDEENGISAAILVDLLRRSGQMEKAREAIDARRGGVTEDIVSRMLDFQVCLIDKNDCATHTIAEAVGEI